MSNIPEREVSPAAPASAPGREPEPLVLLCGLLCDETVWDHQRAALSRLCPVEVVSFPDCNSIEAMARQVLERAPPRFAVAGHSMGGRVAIEVYRHAPSRVARLALLNTGYHVRRPGEAESRQALIDLAASEGMEALARQWLPGMVASRRQSDALLMRPLADMVRRASLSSFRQQVRALLDRPDAAATLPRVACPTLIATGADDRWSGIAQHEEIAALVPQGRLAIIPDCGHFSLVEQPEAVTDLLASWLLDVSPEPRLAEGEPA